MVARRCLYVILVLAAVAGVSLHAQAPQAIPAVSEIRKLLESSEPRDQAWGCWWAMQANARELSPEIERVATSTGAVKFPDTLAIDAAADALVQLNVKVPVTVATALYERRPTQALILLSRGRDDVNPVLVNLVRTAQGVRWLAASNLAVARRAPGVASALLENIDIQAKVFVQDSPLKSSGSAVSLGSFSVSDGIAVNDRAFPPLAEYYMDDEARAIKRPTITVGIEDMRGKRMQQASKLFASRFFASRLFPPVLLCSCSPVLPGSSPSVLESSSVLPALP